MIVLVREEIRNGSGQRGREEAPLSMLARNAGGGVWISKIYGEIVPRDSVA